MIKKSFLSTPDKIKFFLSIMMIFFVVQLQSQFTPSYFIVQYLKVSPAMENEYLQLETEVWKKMHQARIDAGVLDGWYLFRLISPAGTKTEYNYVTVLQYSDADKLSGHFESYGVDYTKLLDNDEIAFALKTPEIRDLVYEEVWTSVDQIMKPNPEKMYRFQVFNAMKMRDGTSEDEYQKMELEFWKPMHLRRIATDKMHGWGMYNMIIPGGTERAFHWATVDYYDNFIDIMRNNDPILTSIYGEKDRAKLVKKTDAIRDLLRAEVRELLDYANNEEISN